MHGPRNVKFPEAVSRGFMPFLQKWLQTHHKAQVSNLGVPFLNILFLNTWNSSVSLKVMPKIQGNKINQKQCSQSAKASSQREYYDQRIVKAFVLIQTPASLALGPEAEILNVLVKTGWDTRKFVADVVVNVSCHIREENSFWFVRCEWDSVYLASRRLRWSSG